MAERTDDMRRAACRAACRAALPGLREHPAVVRAVETGVGPWVSLEIELRYPFTLRRTFSGGWVPACVLEEGGAALDLVALARRIGHASGMRACALQLSRVRQGFSAEEGNTFAWLTFAAAPGQAVPGDPVDLDGDPATPTGGFREAYRYLAPYTRQREEG